MLADAHARGRHDSVAIKAASELGDGVVAVVARDPEEHRLRAGRPQQRCERVAVRVHHLPAGDGLFDLVEIDELIARGEDRDPGATADRHGRVPGQCEDPDRRRRDLGSFAHHRGAHLHILTSPPDVTVRVRCLPDLHRSVGPSVGVLHPDDSRRAIRHRSARHHLHGRARPEGSFRKRAGRDLLRYRKPHGSFGRQRAEILRPNGKPVHRAVVPRRVVHPASDLLGQREAQGVVQRNSLHAEATTSLQRARQGVGVRKPIRGVAHLSMRSVGRGPVAPRSDPRRPSPPIQARRSRSRAR